MSASVMQSTYSSQHCGCDFCSSRRSVNAKKLAVSQMAAQQRASCNCQCHAKERQRGGGPAFNPDYPEPVNQTALNASRARNGVSGGNAYTIKNKSTRPGTGGSLNGSGAAEMETPEQRQAREVAELDALERLLISEYKARTRATLEAERLKSASANSPARRPQPLPEGYSGEGGYGDSAPYGESPASWDRSGPAGSGSYGQNASTIHEAYAMAQECPVTPPVQCHASHRLQDTLDDVRKVTSDPVNMSNRQALQRVLQKHGMGDSRAGSATSSVQGDAAANTTANTAAENAFGSSLAQIRTSNAHPRGAGVVWSTAAAPSQNSAKDTNVLVVNNATGKRTPPPLSPSATATGAAAQPTPTGRHVTYAV